MTVRTQKEESSTKQLHGDAFHQFSDRFNESDFGDDSFAFQRFSNLGDLGASNDTMNCNVENDADVGKVKNNKVIHQLPVIRLSASSTSGSDETGETESPSSLESSEEFSGDYGRSTHHNSENNSRGRSTSPYHRPSDRRRGGTSDSEQRRGSIDVSSSHRRRSPHGARPMSIPMAPNLDSSSHHGSSSEHGLRSVRSSRSSDELGPRRARPRDQDGSERSTRSSSVSRRASRRSKSAGTHETAARLITDKENGDDNESSDRASPRRRAARNEPEVNATNTKEMLHNSPPPRNPSSSSRRGERSVLDVSRSRGRGASVDPSSRHGERGSLDARLPRTREGSVDPSSRRSRERSVDARVARAPRENSVGASRRSRERTQESSTAARPRDRSVSQRESPRGRSSSISRRPPPRALSNERTSTANQSLNSSTHSRSNVPYDSSVPATPLARRGGRKDTILGETIPRSSSTGALDKCRLRSKSPGVFRNRRTLGANGFDASAMTPNNDRLRALGQLLADSKEKPVDDVEDACDDNMLGDLLTTDLSGKELRKVLRDQLKQAAKAKRAKEVDASATSLVVHDDGKNEVLTPRSDPSSAWQLREKEKEARRHSIENCPKAPAELPPAFASMRPPTTPVNTAGHRRFTRASSVGTVGYSPKPLVDRTEASPSKAVLVSPGDTSPPKDRSHSRERRSAPAWHLRVQERSNGAPVVRRCTIGGSSAASSSGIDAGLPPAFRSISKSPGTRAGKKELERRAALKQNRKESVKSSIFSILDGDPVEQ